jgi:hypothetical protein
MKPIRMDGLYSEYDHDGDPIYPEHNCVFKFPTEPNAHAHSI